MLISKHTKDTRFDDSAVGGTEETMATEIRLFYIQDARQFCGNSVFWWRPDGHGYTTNLADAWRVSGRKAEQICRSRDTDKMWPCDEVDALAQKHFDFQNLRYLKAVSDFPTPPCSENVASGVDESAGDVSV